MRAHASRDVHHAACNLCSASRCMQPPQVQRCERPAGQRPLTRRLFRALSHTATARLTHAQQGKGEVHTSPLPCSPQGTARAHLRTRTHARTRAWSSSRTRTHSRAHAYARALHARAQAAMHVCFSGLDGDGLNVFCENMSATSSCIQASARKPCACMRPSSCVRVRASAWVLVPGAQMVWPCTEVPAGAQ